MAGCCQALHDMAADEAAAAKNCHKHGPNP
jgi:hypothetical protein